MTNLACCMLASDIELDNTKLTVPSIPEICWTHPAIPEFGGGLIRCTSEDRGMDEVFRLADIIEDIKKRRISEGEDASDDALESALHEHLAFLRKEEIARAVARAAEQIAELQKFIEANTEENDDNEGGYNE